jgi:hypothetical protein
MFEPLEIEADKQKVQCPHTHFEDTVTIWPGETFERLTSTCKACRKVFGRYYRRH